MVTPASALLFLFSVSTSPRTLSFSYLKPGKAMPFLGSPGTPRPYASKITPTFLGRPGTPRQYFRSVSPSKGKDPDPYSCRIFRHGSFFWGVRSDPDPCFHKLFGEVAPISHEPGRPRQALRYTTRGDGGGRGSPIKKLGLGRHLSEIQRECLSGVSPSSAIKKGRPFERYRQAFRALASVG